MLKILDRFGLTGSRAAPGRTAATPLSEPLWLEWISLGGLLLFSAWLLGAQGVWGLLLRSDPTGITLVIIVLFSGATLWCGARTSELQTQHKALRLHPLGGADAAACWAGDYSAAVWPRW